MFAHVVSGVLLIIFFSWAAPALALVLLGYYGILTANWLFSAPEISIENESENETYWPAVKNDFPVYRPTEITSQHGSRRWATSVLANSSNHLIIDTETTGLSGRDEVIEVAIIEMNGDKVFHSHIKPPKRRKMPPDAERIHGISISFLKDKPTLEQVWPGIQAALCGKTLIAYNAEFDERLLRQTCKKYDLQPLGNRWECAMIPYAAWVGEWNDYRNDYKWQKLPSAGHDALSDCLATRKIIIEMAGGRD